MISLSFMISQVSIGGNKTAADIQCVLADRTAWELHAQWKLTIVTVLHKTLTLGIVFLFCSLCPPLPQSMNDYFGKSPSCVQHIKPAPKINKLTQIILSAFMLNTSKKCAGSSFLLSLLGCMCKRCFL